jgi:predicted alpha-1,6-mannanase (GH76 family)
MEKSSESKQVDAHAQRLVDVVCFIGMKWPRDAELAQSRVRYSASKYSGTVLSKVKTIDRISRKSTGGRTNNSCISELKMRCTTTRII